MQPQPSRKAFARSRPLPAFGTVIALVIDVLELRDPATYGTRWKESKTLQEAIDFLDPKNGTVQRIASGGIVKEDTKRRICEALSICLRSLPAFPADAVPDGKLEESLRSAWAAYEHLSEVVGCQPVSLETFASPLWRHATLEIAIRAGAAASLCGDEIADDITPIWSDRLRTRDHLAKVVAHISTRDQVVEQVSTSPSEYDRWLDKDDIPSPGHIARLEGLVTNGGTKDSRPHGRHHLFRLFAGRRFWKKIENNLPAAGREDCLRAFCRVKQRVQTYFAFRNGETERNHRDFAALLLVSARVPERAAAMRLQLMLGEEDIIWQKHIEAMTAGPDGWDGHALRSIIQSYANSAGAAEEFERRMGVQCPLGLDDSIRLYLQVPNGGPSRLAAMSHLTQEAEALERKGDFAGAETCMLRIVEMWPTAAAWNSLGRSAVMQRRPKDAEDRYRKALKLQPHHFESRTDLALLLANQNRPRKALDELDMCSDVEKEGPVWRFVRGRALMVDRQFDAATQEFLKCVEQRFKVGMCCAWLADTAEAQGHSGTALEYRKRARELGQEARPSLGTITAPGSA